MLNWTKYGSTQFVDMVMNIHFFLVVQFSVNTAEHFIPSIEKVTIDSI